jgi:hypothetical protein
MNDGHLYTSLHVHNSFFFMHSLLLEATCSQTQPNVPVHSLLCYITTVTTPALTLRVHKILKSPCEIWDFESSDNLDCVCVIAQYSVMDGYQCCGEIAASILKAEYASQCEHKLPSTNDQQYAIILQLYFPLLSLPPLCYHILQFTFLTPCTYFHTTHFYHILTHCTPCCYYVIQPALFYITCYTY